MTIRVAAVQFQVGPDVTANLSTCLRLIEQAARRGAGLIVLPASCNHPSFYRDRAHAQAVATRPEDRFLTSVSAQAAHYRVFVKLNVTHACPDGRTGSTNLLFGPDGRLLGNCDKQTLMGAENGHLDPAVEVGSVLHTSLGRLGMYACPEGLLSEVPRGLALRGAQILLNSLDSFATDEAELHVPVRAAENRVWVVAANKVGPLLPPAQLPALAAELDDAIFPETFRLAALADADVVAVPFTPREPWELRLGIAERAAENRLNIIAAGPPATGAAVCALGGKLTLPAVRHGPFTGRISSPLRTDIPADEPVVYATVNPAHAVNRLVFPRTDLVDGRPWRLLGALTERR